MRTKLVKRIVAAVGIACCSLCILATPVSAPITAQAAASNESVASPNYAEKGWYYKESNGKLYKRLYNYATGLWETDWIYVRDL